MFEAASGELSHEIERAIVFDESQELRFANLAVSGAAEPSLADPKDWLNPSFSFPAEGFSLEDAINRLMALALKQTSNNVSGAARLLGVSRDYIRYRLSGQKDAEEPPKSSGE